MADIASTSLPVERASCGLRLLLCLAHVAHQRLAPRSFSLVSGCRFFFICTLGRFGRAPRQFPCFRKLPAISGSVGFDIEHNVFESRLSHQPSRLTLHSCRVVLQEINKVKDLVICRIIQIVGLRLLRCRPGFVQTVNIQIVANEVRVGESASRTEFYRLLRRSEGLIVVAKNVVDVAQVGGRNVVARVGLRPQFIGLARCFQVPGDVIFIVRNDVKLFTLAYPFAQFVGLASIFGGTRGLAQVRRSSSPAARRP